MIRFECDYTEGAHPRILDALVKTNREQTPGYGEDEYCSTAEKIIRIACGREDMDVHFLMGGTQANATVTDALLKPYQGVICADSAHIANHETGAVEATGHKVLTVPTEEGKLTAAQVRELYSAHWNDSTHEHMVQPGMVYISQPTETGLLYTKRELTELKRVCEGFHIPLYVDGARLGYALGAAQNDVFMADLASLCDVFYIGGTKCGAMFGEAVCICTDRFKEDFRYNIKRHGGMLAKGRFLGIQFDTLLREGLYIEICKKAVDQAMRIKQAFLDGGCQFRYDSFTNQQFPILNSIIYKELSKSYTFSLWEKLEGDKTVVRFVTSWATKDDNVDALTADVRRLCMLYGGFGEKKPEEETEEPEEPEEPAAVPSRRRKKLL